MRLVLKVGNIFCIKLLSYYIINQCDRNKRGEKKKMLTTNNVYKLGLQFLAAAVPASVAAETAAIRVRLLLQLVEDDLRRFCQFDVVVHGDFSQERVRLVLVRLVHSHEFFFRPKDRF